MQTRGISLPLYRHQRCNQSSTTAMRQRLPWRTRAIPGLGSPVDHSKSGGKTLCPHTCAPAEGQAGALLKPLQVLTVDTSVWASMLLFPITNSQRTTSDKHSIVWEDAGPRAGVMFPKYGPLFTPLPPRCSSPDGPLELGKWASQSRPISRAYCTEAFRADRPRALCS